MGRWVDVWEIVKMPYYFQFSLLFVLVMLHAYWIGQLFIVAYMAIKKKSVTISSDPKRNKIIEDLKAKKKI